MMGLTLAERRAVTETTAIRYSLADNRAKGIILDELCATTGWHRNHARKALTMALQPRLVSREKSAATDVWTGCHCRIDGVLDGAGNAGRQAAGADVERIGGGVASFRGAGHR
jgi:hypothetical protein